MVSTKTVSRFDIYWVDLDPTKGSEIQKTRPCIIVSPDEMNEVLKTIIVVPLTSTIIDWPFRTTILVSSKKSSAACDQIRTISKERLRGRIGAITDTEKETILEILQSVMSD